MCRGSVSVPICHLVGTVDPLHLHVDREGTTERDGVNLILLYCFPGSECKPCSDSCAVDGSPQCGPLSAQPSSPSDAGTGSVSSLSPASIAEDSFFPRPTAEDQVRPVPLSSLLRPILERCVPRQSGGRMVW